MKKTKRPTKIQEEMLLECLEERLWLVLGSNRTAASRARARASWQEISKLLNQHRNGAFKTWMQWLKYWKDKKATLKKKLQELEKNQLSVADSSSYLTEFEQEMLRIIMEVEQCQVNMEPELSAQAGGSLNKGCSQSDNSPALLAEHEGSESLLQSEKNEALLQSQNEEVEDGTGEQSPEPAYPNCCVSEWTETPPKHKIPLTETIESVDPSNSTMKRTKRPTVQQEEVLVKCLEEKLWLVQGNHRLESARARARAAWQDIAKILNHQRIGTFKSREQWKKYWLHKKAALKKKLQQLENNQPSGITEFTDLEQRMLKIIKRVERPRISDTKPARSQAGGSPDRRGSQSPADNTEDEDVEAPSQLQNVEDQQDTDEQRLELAYPTLSDTEWTAKHPGQWMAPQTEVIEGDPYSSTRNVARAKAPTLLQQEVLLKFLEKRLWLVTGQQHLSRTSRMRATAAWQKLGKILNHQRNGTFKSQLQWRKYWMDKKAALKGRIQGLQLSAAAPSVGVEFNDLEQRMLKIIMQVEHSQISDTDTALSSQAGVSPNRGSQLLEDKTEHNKAKDSTDEQIPDPVQPTRISETTRQRRVPRKKRKSERCMAIDVPPNNSTRNVPRAKAPTLLQQEELLKCLEKKLWLGQGRNQFTAERLRSRAAWLEIARKLNSHRGGAYRSWSAWAKYWKDKKASLKRKLQQIENNQSAKQTNCITGIEQRMLKILMRVERSAVSDTEPAPSQAEVSPNRSGSQSPVDNAEDSTGTEV